VRRKASTPLFPSRTLSSTIEQGSGRAWQNAGNNASAMWPTGYVYQ
jgi:hypothetical protein